MEVPAWGSCEQKKTNEKPNFKWKIHNTWVELRRDELRALKLVENGNYFEIRKAIDQYREKLQ